MNPTQTQFKYKLHLIKVKVYATKKLIPNLYTYVSIEREQTIFQVIKEIHISS